MSDPPYSKLLLDEALRDIGLAGMPYEVSGHAPILWSGWEGDHHAVLVRTQDGAEHAVILSGTLAEGRTGVASVLRERLRAYEEAMAGTRALLAALEAAPKEFP